MEENSKKKSIIGIIAVIAVILIAVILFVCFNGKTYTVTFETDGGTTISAQKVKNGKTVEKPKEPKKEGYDFVKWLLNGKEYDFTDKVSGDIKLKAEWSKSLAASTDVNQNQTQEQKPEEKPAEEQNNVAENTTKETTVKLSSGNFTLNVGASKKITATIDSSTLTDKTVTWSSSNTNVATVDNNGTVVGKAAGTATITAKTADGKTATCKVTVKVATENNNNNNNNQPSTPSEPEKPAEQTPATPDNGNNQGGNAGTETPGVNENQGGNTGAGDNAGAGNNQEEPTPVEPEPVEKPTYRVVVSAIDEYSPQRMVEVFDNNGNKVTPTSICNASKVQITSASRNWTINKSEKNSMQLVCISGEYYDITSVTEKAD